MIELAKWLTRSRARSVQTYEQEVDEPQREAYGKIAKCTFACTFERVPGRDIHARLAFGEVKGYTERIGNHNTTGRPPSRRHLRITPRTRQQSPFELPAIGNQRKVAVEPFDAF